MKSPRSIESLSCGSGRFAFRTHDGCLWLGGPDSFGEDWPSLREPQILHTAGRSLAFGDVGWAVLHADGRLVFTSAPCATATQIFKSGDALKDSGFELPGRYQQCAIGEFHTLALDDQGGVWAWGENRFGQLGTPPNAVPDHRSLQESLKEVLAGQVCVEEAQRQGEERRLVMEGVVQIQAGQDCSFALTRDGILYGWGLGSFGELLGEPAPFRRVNYYDLPVDDKIRMRPQMLIERHEPEVLLYDVAKISASRRHVLALKTDGSLWGWGANQYGQARGDGVTCPASGLHLLADDALDCAAGASHSAFIDHCGRLFTWGSNEDGQLGCGTTTAHSRILEIGEGYVQVACGQHLTLALHGSGQLHHMGLVAWQDPDHPSMVLRNLRPQVIWTP